MCSGMFGTVLTCYLLNVTFVALLTHNVRAETEGILCKLSILVIQLRSDNLLKCTYCFRIG